MGEQYFDLINTIKQPAYSVINTRLELSYKIASLSFWVKNIANQQYIMYAMPGYFRYTVLNRPRAFGFTLGVVF
jgi:iron complex outermembrane receptor protein